MGEHRLLQALLARNKPQHRRTGYFRALAGAEASLKRLEPALTEALGGRNPILLRAALVTTAELAHRLHRSSITLRQQIAASYYMALCLTLAAVTARIYALLRPIAIRMLAVHRSCEQSEDPLSLEPALAKALELLIANPIQQVQSTRALGQIIIPSTGIDSGHDDLGECVPFAQPPVDKMATSPDCAALPPESSIPLLAVDYSDSEDSEEVDFEKKVTVQCVDPSSMLWRVDTDPLALDFFGTTATLTRPESIRKRPRSPQRLVAKVASTSTSCPLQSSVEAPAIEVRDPGGVLATDYSASESDEEDETRPIINEANHKPKSTVAAVKQTVISSVASTCLQQRSAAPKVLTKTMKNKPQDLRSVIAGASKRFKSKLKKKRDQSPGSKATSNGGDAIDDIFGLCS